MFHGSAGEALIARRQSEAFPKRRCAIESGEIDPTISRQQDRDGKGALEAPNIP
jgi:hypothetical protein